MQTKIEEKKKQVYEVLILKHDLNYITALQTDKYDSAFECWNLLTNAWTKSLTDKVPFIMKEPIVTAFDPGAIKEITIRPIMEVPESKYDNPYQKAMMKSGLSNTLKTQGHPVNAEMLDEGYQ